MDMQVCWCVPVCECVGRWIWALFVQYVFSGLFVIQVVVGVKWTKINERIYVDS